MSLHWQRVASGVQIQWFFLQRSFACCSPRLLAVPPLAQAPMSSGRGILGRSHNYDGADAERLSILDSLSILQALTRLFTRV
jgi:hypothetical protein